MSGVKRKSLMLVTASSTANTPDNPKIQEPRYASIRDPKSELGKRKKPGSEMPSDARGGISISFAINPTSYVAEPVSSSLKLRAG
jgi:hypothetical protein